MNSLYSSNHKKGKQNLSNAWKIIWSRPGFEPSTATPNLTLRTTGTYFPKGTLKLFNSLFYVFTCTLCFQYICFLLATYLSKNSVLIIKNRALEQGHVIKRL